MASRTSPYRPEAAVSTADHERLRAWTDHLLAEPQQLPFSFSLGDTAVRGIPHTWSPSTTHQWAGPSVLQTVHRGREPLSGLEVRAEVVRYRDYPVVEWTVWLTNPTEQVSLPIRDLRGVDASFDGSGAQVRHGNGDFFSEDGYSWVSTPLAGGEAVEMEPSGGRPCDGAFPYLRVLLEGSGLTVAIGWPGQWSARLWEEEEAVRIQAGQAHTDLRLAPGETVRTPRISIMAWDGTERRAVNLWRRWYRDHVMPRPAGKVVTPLLAASATDEGVEFTAADEQNQLRYQDRFAAKGVDYDVWWIDAGWYPCRDEAGVADWTITGTWRADTSRFPRGLRPVADGAASHEAGLLLWFEPERVVPGTELASTHPEWMLDRPRATTGGRVRPRELSCLLDLSNPDCRSWLADYLDEMISSYGLSIYRQDFNFPPLEYWRARDGADRQGLTENLYVQGYLELWDTLLERHPGLLIDSCASGGRRNDLETMRRSVPLHYTDYGYGEHAVKLDFHRTMFEWLPYFKETNLSGDLEVARGSGVPAAVGDSYAFHCGFAPMLGLALDIRQDDQDFEAVRRSIAVWREIAEPILYGDYYPLARPDRTGKDWVAWQFDRPADLAGRGRPDGFVQAVRHLTCDDDSLTVHLEALRPGTTYSLQELESGERREMTGHALMNEGLVFDLARRQGRIWYYREESDR
jgi:alpha-galactosidase